MKLPTARQDRCIHRLFEQQAERTPDAIALVCGGESLTYRQLNQRANRLAHYLQSRGAGRDALVGICMHRCVQMVVAIFAVLKAGGAYVPFDPAYPRQRLATMLADVQLTVLLTSTQLLAELPEGWAQALCLDRAAAAIEAEPDGNLGWSSPDSLAYAIFTSGSTGQAKVAGVYQRGWANLLDWFASEFQIGAGDRVLVISSFSFDITQRSIAMPLIAGGQLHLLDSVVYDPGEIGRTIKRAGITLVNCAPSTFYPLIETSATGWPLLAGLRAVFLGGEPISASRLRAWALAPDCPAEVVNVYGVAECSDVSTFHRLREYDRYVATSVPIGKPIPHTQIYLADDDLTPVPPGEPGEICIAGTGVGAGYINDPALTAEKFAGNPFSPRPGARLYRTGDLGRFLPDGTLTLIGRADHQVKIRGHRVDPGDVETNLRLHPDVSEAVVIGKAAGAGDRRLVAYVVPSAAAAGKSDLIKELREFARERLPEYMVPAWFILLAALPLSPNGKVDRQALTQRPVAFAAPAPTARPRSALEARIASTFAEVLGIEQVGITDNFFHSGGNSYLVTLLLSQLTDSSGAGLSIFDFLAGPTVAQVANVIEGHDQLARPPSPDR